MQDIDQHYTKITLSAVFLLAFHRSSLFSMNVHDKKGIANTPYSHEERKTSARDDFVHVRINKK